MKRLVTENEVTFLGFNRNLQLGTIKQAHIDVAEMVWCELYLGQTFYKHILNNTGDYTELVEDYCKPLVSWGTLYQSFEYLSVQITEKGIIQMVSEGVANLLDRTTRGDMKLEVRHICLKLAEKMQRYCKEKKAAGDSLFQLYDPVNITTNSFGYYGKIRTNQIVY